MDSIKEEVKDGESTSSLNSVVVKQEPAWSMEEESPDQPSAVYSTVQPMSDNTSESLLSLKRGRVCQHCSAAFVLFSSLELHLASVHGEKLHMVLPGSSTPDRYDAGNHNNTDQKKQFSNFSDIKVKITDNVHLVTAASKKKKDSCKKHVCDVCKKSFATPSKLSSHKITHCGLRPYTCNLCNKSFTRIFSLNKHELLHSRGKRFACDVCDKTFSEAGNLKKHKLLHIDHRPFVCKMCRKRFSQAAHLQKHYSTHTKETPHKCPQCDKEFKWPSYVLLHMKSIHGGQRPYVCDVCGAAFARSSTLKLHKRTHTGEKPHVCPDCGKGFAQSGSLESHRATHTKKKPHVCSDCGKSFARPFTLAKHQETHTKEKPFVCPECGERFVRASSLGKHRRSHQPAPAEEKPKNPVIYVLSNYHSI